MKKLIFLLLMALLAHGARPQNFSEWFRQKKTQKKYLVKQIAALQVYLEQVKKGYSIVQEGLATIGGIKEGQLGLHGNYFNALKKVNPGVKDHEKVAAIFVLHQKTERACGQAFALAMESGAFSPEEASYIGRVFARLLDDCAATVRELDRTTTAGPYEMKDGERLRRIHALYAEMLDQYRFAKSFGNGTWVLAVSRTKEKSNIQTSRSLNGIKNE